MSRAARWTLCVLFLLLPVFSGAAERGFPLLTVYPPEVHKAGPQTFDVTQDERGVLYFGNLHGLVTFDGAWWELHKLPKDQVALALSSDRQGRVVLGLMNDFGFMARNAMGSYEYRSLLDTLPPQQREIGDVRDICRTPAGFLFVAEKGLLTWNSGAARMVTAFSSPDAPRGCFFDGANMFLRGPKGLQQLDLQTFRATPAGVDVRVNHVLRLSDGKLLAVTRENGLFVVDKGTATPFSPELGAWLKGKIPTGGCRLDDGRLIVTTRQHGLAIFNEAGHIEQIINVEAGLPDAVVNSAFVDREGALWLAMEGPIVRIDLSSPVTIFDARRGVRGGAGDVAQFDGRLYAATTHGLFVSEGSGPAVRIEAVQDAAWRLLRVDDELLVGTSKGVWCVHRGGAIEHEIPMERELYDMFRSPTDPSRVWLAHGEGIGSMRRINGKWTFEGLLPGINQEIASVVEDDGALWAGTVFNGILKVTGARGPQQKIQQYGTGEMNVYSVSGRPVLVRASGEVVEVGPKGDLVPDSQLGHLSAPRGFFVVAADRRGNVWINSTPPRIFARNAAGWYASEGRPLVAVTAADIQNIRVTDDGAVWFAADKGLFRYDPSGAAEVFAPQPRPLVRRVVAGEGRVLFGGATPSVREAVTLRHDFGRIRIEFAPASYRPGVEYQYRLDPMDAGWSPWTDQPFIDYTTLSANEYTFRLRARGAGSAPSPEAQWSFTVLSPWYATRWAYGIWILLAVALVLLAIRIRTGTLRRRAEHLQAKVNEKTAELKETVQLLEVANMRLETLSLEDDLTGIANRRYFERALADEWNRARRREQPLALIVLDLDRFKELNDRRGHPAGDDCLRRVGAFLSEAVRRSGEVVARYGGEEFVILLPGVDAEAAIRVAENLRQGIENLAIPYSHNGTRRVTASCGVAAMIPAADATAEHLVAHADRALYAAKHSGRNCVRMADESTTGTWLRDASAS